MIKILVAEFSDQIKQPTKTSHSSQVHDLCQELSLEGVISGATTEQPSPDWL
jgi:hypothetical protein